MNVRTVQKVISGGQTGVDIAGIDTAIELNLDWGGTVPRGRPQELGSVIPARYDRFVEHVSAEWLPRTRVNVDDADATVIITNGRLRGGTWQTWKYAEKTSPVHVADLGDPRRTRDWLDVVFHSNMRARGDVNHPFTINIAGPRASKWPSGYDAARTFLRMVLV